MFMQLLGPNLEHLFNNSGRKFKLTTVLLLGIQIINLLKDLHNIHYIHRDIKPSNFLIGRGGDIDQIYIMDFGLSRKYIRKKKHIKHRTDRSLVGTARYASCNMHKGIEPSRRDELESVGYMLIYFLRGKLPWQGIPKERGKKHINVIGNKKINTDMNDLCYGIPDCFKHYTTYCKSLEFDADPDYDYLCGLFCNYCSQNGIIPRYEWV
jgi:serine/threonine protein kinase